jgi:hypothetical protein
VILVDTVGDGAIPNSAATDLRPATVALYYQEIAVLQSQPFELGAEQLDRVYLGQVQSIPKNIRDPKKRDCVIPWGSFGLLLDATLDRCDFSERAPAPTRRQLTKVDQAASLSFSSSRISA